MPTVQEIAEEIKKLDQSVVAVFQAHGWSQDTPLSQINAYLPPFPIKYLIGYIHFTAEKVRSLSSNDLKKSGISSFLVDISSAISSMQFNNFANDPDAVFGSWMSTLHLINSRLPSEAKGPVQIDWESVEDKSIFPKDIARRLRAVASRLDDLEPRAAEIDKKIGDIEAADEAAEQLPEDLAELAAKRAEVSKIVSQAEDFLEQATKVAAKIEATSDAAADARKRMGMAETQAQRLIEKSEQALRGSTGVGLANAFEKRKGSLTFAGTAWVVGLVGALVAAFLIGSDRVKALQAVLGNESPLQIVWVNVILTVFGIGGPIWFAWLSTKQAAVNFKLAEDYAFKAAVSKAYEGYRKEAVEIDPALQARLFASALDRLEEAPIRLMDRETHSSPLQELLSNPAIRKSLDGIPGIADKIIALIPQKGVATVIAPAAAIAAAVDGVIASPAKKPAKATEDAE